MRSVDVHRFAMVPRANVPRSAFRLENTYKTTFDGGWLIPVYCEEVLPGDEWRGEMTAFARLATPIVPIMDNLYLDSFFFFCPNRLVWANWVRFMGEQPSPGDSTAFTIPQVDMPTGGYPVGSIYDYFGLPTAGQVPGGNGAFTANVLPLRAYRLIYNQWFRDQNLVTLLPASTGDGPDANSSYALQRRGKRHDYFTSALPWPQKGVASPLIVSGTVPVTALTTEHTTTGTNSPLKMRDTSTNNLPGANTTMGIDTGGNVGRSASAYTAAQTLYPTNLYANLDLATTNTINQLRAAAAAQQLLERDARGGTRYTEIVWNQFGVQSPDMRLDRPEYIGGGSTMFGVHPVAQTSATGITGGTTPAGSLSGFATASGTHRFRMAAQEHGYIIGLVAVRADLTYQQGVRKHWNRLTRLDYYTPDLAHLGEQAILNREIYVQASSVDTQVFGYTERWNEYRYAPSMITGLFRSTSAGAIDIWHLAQRFTSLPTLNATFINDTPPLSRILALSSGGREVIFDSIFSAIAVRPLPMFSVPGLDRL